jgi:hypothetical protein
VWKDPPALLVFAKWTGYREKIDSDKRVNVLVFSMIVVDSFLLNKECTDGRLKQIEYYRALIIDNSYEIRVHWPHICPNLWSLIAPCFGKNHHFSLWVGRHSRG